MNNGALTPSTDARRISFLLGLLSVLAIFLLLRVRWFGHLLMWDEAMNLCAARAFAAGGHDAYSQWFWRYPPLFELLLTCVRPLAAGFAARAEWLTILINSAQLITLVSLNRRVFGFGPALWSGLALATMPGSVFFGLWIKQDNLTALLGLVALLFCARRMTVFCGVALGLAMLSKEMAAFYALSIAIVMASERRFRDLAIVAVIAGIMSLWWYVGFSISVMDFFKYVVDGPRADTAVLWSRPWFYYVKQLPTELGWLGIALAALGALSLVNKRGIALWPLSLFVPAFLIITLARGKTPWYMMTLYPALATLQGVGACAILNRLKKIVPGAIVPATATAAAAIFLALPSLEHSYEEIMQAREPGMWQASFGSREAAVALNGLVKDEQKVLITPMHFYEGVVKQPCPIFVIYLKDMPVLTRRNDISAKQFVEDVREYGLDWAMVSPPPDRGERELIGPLKREYGLRPRVLREAVIFNTASLR